jgi:hypothetical protein
VSAPDVSFPGRALEWVVSTAVGGAVCQLEGRESPDWASTLDTYELDP